LLFSTYFQNILTLYSNCSYSYNCNCP